MGTTLDPEAFREALEADTNKEIKAVILTHSETSSGVLNDLETINRHVKAHGEALIIVDAVTSLGAATFPSMSGARCGGVWLPERLYDSSRVRLHFHERSRLESL